MKTLLIATKNQGKAQEFAEILAPLGFTIKTLFDFPNLPDIEETGATFEENALLKAKTLSALTGELVIADDSGLCVDALDGAPGIYSHRYAGDNPTAAENNQKLLAALSALTDRQSRRAHFHATIVAMRPDYPEPLIAASDWQGYIAEMPRGKAGFGYDPLFLVGESDATAAELTEAEKNKVSHRAQAIQKLLAALPAWLEKGAGK